VKVRAASDQAILAYLGEEIGQAAHERVLKLLRLLQQEPPRWIRNVQPAYCSLLVNFDISLADHAEVEETIRSYEQRTEKHRAPKTSRVEIPVCYGGEFGPDLDEVAAVHGLKPAQVIEVHSSETYHAYFLGFAPGFAYLGDLPAAIATPRLSSPRKRVPAGSVGIAGRQTAVYPMATPGAWRLLGRTPLRMFRTDHKMMGLISIGDQVRFRPISNREFAELERE
jgi:inhibitor of KinA